MKLNSKQVQNFCNHICTVLDTKLEQRLRAAEKVAFTKNARGKRSFDALWIFVAKDFVYASYAAIENDYRQENVALVIFCTVGRSGLAPKNTTENLRLKLAFERGTSTEKCGVSRVIWLNRAQQITREWLKTNKVRIDRIVEVLAMEKL